MDIKFSPPDIREEDIKAVEEVLRSGWITTGLKVREFENDIATFCKSEKAVAFNSATAALEMTLRMFGVGKGDEVITSAYTYTASASVIEHVGAKIVLVDTYPDSYFMDLDKLEKAINKHTKVIIPVDIGGIMCDYDKIYEIIERKRNKFRAAKNEFQMLFNRIIVLADGAHSLGATYHGRPSGSVADFTCFSFHAVKNLTTAEGGAVTWPHKDGLDDGYACRKLARMGLHGQSKDAMSKLKKGAWEYDITMLGFKNNMTDIAAALGISQLKRYESLLKRRREIVEKYNKAFRDLNVAPANHFNGDSVSSCHLYLLQLNGFDKEKRNEIIGLLAEQGIAVNVHYKPLPLLSAYKNIGFDINRYPNAYRQYEREITLPLNTILTDEEVDYVIESFIKAYHSVS